MKLKKFNGSPDGRLHAVVAAQSQKDAAELLRQVGFGFLTAGRIRDYFSCGLWGYDADAQFGEEPPCRMVAIRYGYSEPYEVLFSENQ